MRVPDDSGRLIDGQLDWTGGTFSENTRTIASRGLPGGVPRNGLSWLINAGVRGGPIQQRTGWTPLVQEAPWNGLYQGGLLYQPDANHPILLLLIGGSLYKIRLDTDNSVTDLSAQFGQSMPPAADQAYFSQAEMFAVIQAGDNVTLPLFYDLGVEGARPETLVRSRGFIGAGDPQNQIPAASAMDYHAHRLWYSFGRFYAAGDIVFNKSSGTAAYGFRDSVLAVTENPVAIAGDAFVVPSGAGNIRALKHASSLDTTLGQSPLFVFTSRLVFAADPPLTRDDWTAATLGNTPIQRVALVSGGTYAERGVVAVNQDLFFPGLPNGDVRSLSMAIRYFQQWGNVPLSRDVSRALAFNDRSLLRFTTGIEFDNRLLMSTLPIECPAGTGFRAVLPLDFDLISTLNERQPPAWEGVWDFGGGPLVLQMFEGDFGGRQRAFAAVWSDAGQRIEVWEITSDQRFDGGLSQNRVDWQIETPAYTFGNPLALKRLDSAELWLDKILGTVAVRVDYRPDNWPCWIPWRNWTECASKDCREDADGPCLDGGYPIPLDCESFRAMVSLGKPPVQDIPSSARPSDIGYQFQLRITVKGWARVRGILAYAWGVDKRPYEALAPWGSGNPPSVVQRLGGGNVP